MSKQLFSALHLTPSEVPAGDSVEFVIKAVIGQGYTAGPSRLIFDFPGMLGHSRAAIHDHGEPGFIQVYVSNPAVDYHGRAWNSELVEFATHPPSERFSKKGTWGQRQYVLDLEPGLAAGDTIELHWGDSLRGYSPLCKVTTVVPFADFSNTIDIRYYEGHDRGIPDVGRDYEGISRPVPDARFQLRLVIRPRPAERLRVVRNTRRSLALPLDRFWNVTSDDPSSVCSWSAALAPNPTGVCEGPPDVAVKARSLPVLDSPAMSRAHGEYNIYWGDYHTHSSYSVDCLEREKQPLLPHDLMRYARYRAGLDFYAVSDHHITYLFEHWLIGRDRWDDTMAAVERNNAPGDFIVFPGFENGGPRGDTNFLFNYLPTYDEITQGWPNVKAAWKALAGKDYMTIPHFHNPGKLPDLEWWCAPEQRVEPVIEVLSTHGSYQRERVREYHRPLKKSFRPDRCMDYLLAQGYRYGVVGGSDGHKGTVGTNALTACFAAELTRDAIFAAFRARHTYATTNARIRVLFTANGALMGDIVANTSRKVFDIDVTGEAPLKMVELFHNGRLVTTLPGEGIQCRTSYTDSSGEPGYWYVRVTQVDNQVAVTSSIWFV